MATLTLKVKTKDAEHIVSDLTAAATIDDLKRKLAAVTNIQQDCLNVLVGFPPKKLNLSDATLTLDASGIRNGVKLIVEETAATLLPIASTPVVAAAVDRVAADVTGHESIDHGFAAGILLKKVVPSDNSCLFTSIGKMIMNFL